MADGFVQVTLALEPRFKRSITYDYRDDSTFQYDFADKQGRALHIHYNQNTQHHYTHHL
jgi:hypothetical protein